MVSLKLVYSQTFLHTAVTALKIWKPGWVQFGSRINGGRGYGVHIALPNRMAKPLDTCSQASRGF
jgi:hypothetical protein